jgi:2-phospho-L-lactate guanylyltransferase
MISEGAKIWALVPVKRFDQAKQRLSDVLDAQERALLARTMLSDVLHAIADVQELAGIAVITDDETAAQIARSFSARVLGDPAYGGTNVAVASGMTKLRDAGADAVLVVPGDIPLVRPSDLRACLFARRYAPVVLAPASRDGGTNMLLQDCAANFSPAFGPDSFARHLAMARAARLPVGLVLRARIGLDIDRPADLELLLGQADGCATQEILRRFMERRPLSPTALAPLSTTFARCEERHIR